MYLSAILITKFQDILKNLIFFFFLTNKVPKEIHSKFIVLILLILLKRKRKKSFIE